MVVLSSVSAAASKCCFVASASPPVVLASLLVAPVHSLQRAERAEKRRLNGV